MRAADQRDGQLDSDLLAAHAIADRYSLVALYAEAGHRRAERAEMDAACFYWTHARVYALELGDERADSLLTLLAAEGRDA
ncbi:MAG: hypothetical protein AAFV62_09735 [Pseudomonadota bacterium]